MKVLKYIAIFVVTIIMIAVASIIFLVSFVDPNSMKPWIVGEVKKQSHWDMTINGDLSWKFFPMLAIKLSHVTIKSSAKSKEKKQIEFANLDMGVKLLPLIHQKIEFDSVSVDGLTLSPTLKNIRLHAKNIQLNAPFAFDGSIENITFSGTSVIADAQNDLEINGTLTVPRFNLKKSLQALGVDTQNIQEASDAGGQLKFSYQQGKPFVSGIFNIATLIVNHIKLSEIKTNPRLENNILNFSPMTANLYQGKLQGQMRVDVNSAVPAISLNVKLTNIMTEALLKDIDKKSQELFVVGKGNIEFNAVTSGSNADTLVRHLNGSGRFRFDSGRLLGVNINYWIDVANALAKQQPMPKTDSDQTEFDQLNATIAIINGVMRNDDFYINSSNFDGKGKGAINLINRTIDYQLDVNVKKHTADQKDDLTNLYGISLPILVHGGLDNPHIRLDTTAILKAAAEKQINKSSEKAKKRIQEEIQKNLKGPAGDLLQELLK